MDDDKPKKDWKVLERHYKLLSEVWSYEYDDQTRVSKAIMIMHGCLVEMHSEVIKFEQKNGVSDKLKKSEDRLKLLEIQLREISSVQDDYFRIKRNNKSLLFENERLKSMIFEKEKSNILKKIDLGNLPDSIKL